MASPAPFRAMLPLSPLDSPEVTHKQRAFCFPALSPVGPRVRAENDALSALRRRDARGVSAAVLTLSHWYALRWDSVDKTFRLAGRQEGRSSDNATQASDLKVMQTLFPPQLEGIAWLEKFRWPPPPGVSLSALAGSGTGGAVGIIATPLLIITTAPSACVERPRASLVRHSIGKAGQATKPPVSCPVAKSCPTLGLWTAARFRPHTSLQSLQTSCPLYQSAVLSIPSALLLRFSFCLAIFPISGSFNESLASGGQSICFSISSSNNIQVDLLRIKWLGLLVQRTTTKSINSSASS